jgi:hypothetical protein
MKVRGKEVIGGSKDCVFSEPPMLLLVRIDACLGPLIRSATAHAAQTPVNQLGSMHGAVSFESENNVVIFDVL